MGALAGPRTIKSPLSPDTILSIPNLPSVPHEYSFIPFIKQRSQESYLAFLERQIIRGENEVK